MSWASQRLEYLHTDYSYSQISELTEIPVSTISYVIREERNLPDQYKTSLRNTYQREAYQDLKDVGLSATQAARFSWYSPTKVYNVIEEVNNTVTALVNSRFDQYKQFLLDTGQYIDDQGVIDTLKASIQNALRSSDLPEERVAAIEYRNTNEL